MSEGSRSDLTILYGDEPNDPDATTPRLSACDVQVEVDGEWTTVASVADNTAHEVVLAFEPVAAQRLRIAIRKLNQPGYKDAVRVLSEIGVYAR